ncbi:arginase [Paenibacillus phyllosphaerae]|uniref:Arginase n=1 Tax=Paenibacillus phyllosphaerae TaxID=274593 RepID=A0A7W5AVA8_9BACL|nr:arginase [Paenibacillus phyllosphaerae]MBB3109343.1 arginase [Paenibacillus phyllosphaerae]
MNNQLPVSILPVPFDWGAGRRGAAAGPEAVLHAGVIRRLQQLGYRVQLRSEDCLPNTSADRRTAMQLKHWGRVLTINEAIAQEVRSIAAEGLFPLTIGGDHSIALGTIAGAAASRKRLGVIWIDAHGDLNTPETTPSGNIHGMSLAAAIGLGDSRFTGIGGYSPKLAPERIVLVGARELDDGEKKRIRELNITCFTMHEIDRYGMGHVMEEAIRIASADADGVHVSFDIDSVDPGEAPGTGTPVRGGLNYREAHLAMEMLHEAGVVTSADVVEVNPLLDNGQRTARLAVELIASLAGERIL